MLYFFFTYTPIFIIEPQFFEKLNVCIMTVRVRAVIFVYVPYFANYDAVGNTYLLFVQF